MPDKQLTIQIVGWNSAADLPAGLAALAQLPSDAVAITYIDNASHDDSVALVRRRLPQADVVQLPHNTGFAHAHNVGFARARTPYVMVHNPDLVISWAGVQELLRQFEDPAVAAVQGKLLQPDRHHIDSTGIVLTLSLNGKDRGAGERDDGQYDTPSAVTAVTGACGIYRVAALRAVAHSDGEIYDADFFAYKEDVDLGWRLTRAGWRVQYHPAMVGTHARAVRREGKLGWSVRPRQIYSRLRSSRTRHSFRNWVWMIAKNATLPQVLVHEIFIDAHLLVFFLLSLGYPPLFSVWKEIFHKMPQMLEKRVQVQALKSAASTRNWRVAS